ncbi:hypothetical protein OOT46_21950 [Aquabacterium sp. A7-Y]|uniref:hypothetical protein n=1 Tax=Aquabacterium sp. A7-Y TaxID=1349605 RepID=UPI00223D2FB1|nr:hypothetical protein [Aquabacterium sp. A7-Y]MCW7540491.1 hypothetical protein [Aquabacterium sp. A7-Y]
MSGIATVSPVDIGDSELIFDDLETKQILKFFWPHRASRIDLMEVSTEVRRFAQTLLIAAIDASYAMGYIESLFRTVAKPAGLGKMGLKLARRYVRHWWKHATLKDLQDVRIYESVRSRLAVNFKTDMDMLLTDQSLARRLSPFQMASTASPFAWS